MNVFGVPTKLEGPASGTRSRAVSGRNGGGRKKKATYVPDAERRQKLLSAYFPKESSVDKGNSGVKVSANERKDKGGQWQIEKVKDKDLQHEVCSQPPSPPKQSSATEQSGATAHLIVTTKNNMQPNTTEKQNNNDNS